MAHFSQIPIVTAKLHWSGKSHSEFLELRPILNKSSALVQWSAAARPASGPRWRAWRPQGRIALCAAKGSRGHAPVRLGKATEVLQTA